MIRDSVAESTFGPEDWSRHRGCPEVSGFGKAGSGLPNASHGEVPGLRPVADPGHLQAGVNLLAGRAIERSLHPVMAAELEDRFDLNRALDIGLVPLVWSARDPRAARDLQVGEAKLGDTDPPCLWVCQETRQRRSLSHRSASLHHDRLTRPRPGPRVSTHGRFFPARSTQRAARR